MKRKQAPKKNSWRDRLRERFAKRTGKFAARMGEDPREREPIDFSAPSIPYYADLAERFSLARIVLYMLLFIFVIVTLISSRHLITYANLYYLFKDINAASLTAQAQTDLLSYPASTVTPDFAVYRGGLVVAGGEEITVLSASGKQTLSDNVTYAEPRVRAADKYFLTFGLGESGFSVYQSFVRVYSEATDYPVYDACMADNGFFAVVTRSEDYTSEVILYNADMQPVVNCHLGGYVTSVAINPSGNVLAVFSADSAVGKYTTKLTLVHFGGRIKQHSVVMDAMFPAIAGFVADDRVALLTDSGLVILDSDGDRVAETPYGEDAPSLCAMTTVGGGRVAVLSENRENLTESSLKVYDKNGREVYTVNIPSITDATEMCWSGNILFIRTGDSLIRATVGHASLTYTEVEGAVDRNTLAILPDGDRGLLVCGLAQAERFTDGDLTD